MNTLYIDTETTGLDTATDRIVQVAARLQLGGRHLDLNTYIQPSGYEIPDAAFRIHGIHTEFAQTNGLPLDEVLTTLTPLVALADVVVGHYIQYDVEILVAEARRAGHTELAATIDALPQICTKQLSARYLERVGEPADRTATKLAAMFQRLMNQPLDNAHDAYTDVLACEILYNRLRAA